MPSTPSTRTGHLAFANASSRSVLLGMGWKALGMLPCGTSLRPSDNVPRGRKQIGLERSVWVQMFSSRFQDRVAAALRPRTPKIYTRIPYSKNPQSGTLRCSLTSATRGTCRISRTSRPLMLPQARVAFVLEAGFRV